MSETPGRVKGRATPEEPSDAATSTSAPSETAQAADAGDAAATTASPHKSSKPRPNAELPPDSTESPKNRRKRPSEGDLDAAEGPASPSSTPHAQSYKKISMPSPIAI